jgi:hypothetical protein
MMISKEKPKSWETSATSSITNLFWSHTGVNPGLRGEKSASSCLSYDTAIPSLSMNINWLIQNYILF